MIEIRDFGLIGDQKTSAIVDKNGSIIWYCPKAFDHSSLFAAMLDQDKGGSWDIVSEELSFTDRNYISDSGILETHFNTLNGKLTLTDFMPVRNIKYTDIGRIL